MMKREEVLDQVHDLIAIYGELVDINSHQSNIDDYLQTYAGVHNPEDAVQTGALLASAALFLGMNDDVKNSVIEMIQQRLTALGIELPEEEEDILDEEFLAELESSVDDCPHCSVTCCEKHPLYGKDVVHAVAV